MAATVPEMKSKSEDDGSPRASSYVSSEDRGSQTSSSSSSSSTKRFSWLRMGWMGVGKRGKEIRDVGVKTTDGGVPFIF